MESRLGAAALVALLAVLLPTTARADDDVVDAEATADDWLRIGLARYDAGDFKGAVDAFTLGNNLDPRPQFLFAIGQAERRRGNCKAAIVYYQKFIATSPPAEQADAARQQRHICEAAILEAAPPPPKPEPEPAPAAAPPAPEPAPPTPAWYTDPLADVSVGATVLFGLGSAALFFAADSAATQAAAADTYDRHAMLLARADSRHLEAVIALGATTAAAGVAVWRIFFHDRSPHRETRPLALQPGPGLGLALGGSF